MIINSNTPTGTNAPRGELDKANSPAMYTISATPANRPSVVNTFIALFINHIPWLKFTKSKNYTLYNVLWLNTIRNEMW
jgi:hypothetical protein